MFPNAINAPSPKKITLYMLIFRWYMFTYHSQSVVNMALGITHIAIINHDHNHNNQPWLTSDYPPLTSDYPPLTIIMALGITHQQHAKTKSGDAATQPGADPQAQTRSGQTPAEVAKNEAAPFRWKGHGGWSIIHRGIRRMWEIPGLVNIPT